MWVLDMFEEYVHKLDLGEMDSKTAYQKAQKEIDTSSNCD
jgi:hypothetical protein